MLHALRALKILRSNLSQDDKFIRRFEQMERLIRADGRDLAGMSLEEMDIYWEKAKKV